MSCGCLRETHSRSLILMNICYLKMVDVSKIHFLIQ